MVVTYKYHYLGTKIVVLFSVFLLFSFARYAWAQPGIDSATREVDRPVREDVEKRLRPKPSKALELEEEPVRKIPEGPTFFIKKIDIEGIESYSPEEFQTIVSKYEDKEGSLEDLNILAKEISREYIRRGKIAACFVPPQDAKGGIFKLQVIESHMADLEIHDYEYYSVYSDTFKQTERNPLKRFFDRFFNYELFKYDRQVLNDYWTIQPGEVLSYNKMSRILQRMNKNPDRDVNATIHAGTKPKTSNVVLDVKTRFPFHLTSSFDTEGAPPTGKQRKSIGFRHNNFLFSDDSLIYGYTYGTAFSGQYVYHRIPITNFGTNIMYGFNLSKSSPKKQYSVLGVSSRTENANLFVYQDMYKGAEYIGEGFVGFDSKDKTVKQVTGTTNRDRLRIIRVGSNLVLEWFGGLTYLSPEISQGINGFGARRKVLAQDSPVPTSREASNTFTKVKFDASHKHWLPYDMQVSLKTHNQYASEKLASQEQMFLGGIDSVRGYPAGDFLADTATQWSAELLIPAYIVPEDMRLPYSKTTVREDLTGVVFYDWAYGLRRGGTDTPTEKTQVTFSSIGAGIRIRLYNQFLLRLEWGIPIGADRPITETSRSRLHFSISFEDKLPEEIERIMRERAEENIIKTAWGLLNDEINRPENAAFRAKLYEEVYQAKRAYDMGELEASEELYGKVEMKISGLQNQAETYVRECLEQIDSLKYDYSQARDYFYHNEFDKARGLLTKIIEQAKIKPLELEL